MSVYTQQQLSAWLQPLQQIIRQAAAEELLPRFAKVQRRHKSDGSIITAADTAMQQRIIRELQQQWPEIPLLGEEMESAQQQQLLQSKQPLWILDPLDGTTNFAGGLPYFSVSLALLQQGEPVLALVYDPVREEMFSAVQGETACCNGEQLQLPDEPLQMQQALGLIDFKKLDYAIADRLMRQPPYASQRSFGSVALDWCWLAGNRCHLYLHSRQKLWDYAAGTLIFHAAGGISSTIDSSPIRYDHLQRITAVAATQPQLFEQWYLWLQHAK